jgi:hypothetical protein
MTFRRSEKSIWWAVRKEEREMPPWWGTEHQGVGELRRQAHQGMVRARGLRIVAVQPRAAQMAGADGLAQGGVVDESAAAGVDEKAAGLHPGQKIPVHQMPRLGVGGKVQAHDVAGCRQLLQRQTRYAQAGFRLRPRAVAGGVEDPAAMGPQQRRRGLADVSEAHQPHAGAGEVRRDVPLQNLYLPALQAGAHHAVALQDAALEHAHHHHRQLRHGDGVAPGVVAHIDAPLPGGLQVDAVEAHPLGVDEPQLRHPADEARPHDGDGGDEQRLRVAAGGEKLLLAAAPVAEHQLAAGHHGGIAGELLVADPGGPD